MRTDSNKSSCKGFILPYILLLHEMQHSLVLSYMSSCKLSLGRTEGLRLKEIDTTP